jgi:hypothetical protein
VQEEMVVDYEDKNYSKVPHYVTNGSCFRREHDSRGAAKLFLMRRP